ncbi:MAG: DHH family phosphoesterase, partial [Pseudomonadota bacterium]
MSVSIRVRPRCEQTLASALEGGFSPLAARLIAGRVQGFRGDLRAVLASGLGQLGDPSALCDCDRAARRLAAAVEAGEPVALVTDYDVDGITSHALLREALIGRFGVPAGQLQGYIGHRLTDGYGLN